MKVKIEALTHQSLRSTYHSIISRLSSRNLSTKRLDSCVFTQEGNIVPVRIKSMSPEADFIVNQELKTLTGDDEINTNLREGNLVSRYRELLSTEEAKSYRQDVSTHWDPIDQFKIPNRTPLKLLPLSSVSLDELNSVSELFEKIQYDDQWSSKRQDPYQEDKYSYGNLTMPIKLPDSENILLPSNLLASSAIREIVTHSAAVVKANNPFYFRYYWMYCTVHISLAIPPGITQRSEGIHVDGMMGANKNTGEVPLWPKQHVVLSTSIPTAYYNSPWKPPVTSENKPDYTQNWFYLMNKHCKNVVREQPKYLLPNQMHMLTPYTMHEASKNETGKPQNRFFIRIGFCNTHYNGPQYTVNPRLGFFRGLVERAVSNRPKEPDNMVSIPS